MSPTPRIRRDRLQTITPGAVRARRVERGWTQVDLAVRAGISVSLLGWVERGIASQRTIEKLAKALGCEPADLR